MNTTIQGEEAFLLKIYRGMWKRSKEILKLTGNLMGSN